jgi:hypothetical protein
LWILTAWCSLRVCPTTWKVSNGSFSNARSTVKICVKKMSQWVDLIQEVSKMFSRFFQRRLEDAFLLTQPGHSPRLAALSTFGFASFASAAALKPRDVEAIKTSLLQAPCTGPHGSGACAPDNCKSEGSGCSGSCQAVQGYCTVPTSSCWWNGSGWCCDCQCNGGAFCYCEMKDKLADIVPLVPPPTKL